MDLRVQWLFLLWEGFGLPSAAAVYLHGRGRTSKRRMGMEEENRMEEYIRRIGELEAQLAYYQEENSRLQSENDLLHETAWELIRKLRANGIHS